MDWALIAKDLAGETTREEHEKLIKEVSGDQNLLGQINTLWEDAKYAQELSTINTDKAWKNVHLEVQKQAEESYKVKFNWKHYLAIAVTLLVMFLSYFVIKEITPQNRYNKVVAQNQIENVSLGDGTEISLNYKSSVSYPLKFSAYDRTVRLKGEAFFNVARDESRPFIIVTDNLKIKVLGTEFNVNSKVGNGDELVAVASGRVEVSHDGESFIIEKGEAVSYDAQLNSLNKMRITSDNFMAWKTREIKFDNTSLKDVFTTIESVYHIEIETDTLIKLDDMVLKAEFSHNDLDHVLNSVCQTFNLKFEKQDGKFMIMPIQ